MSVDRGEMVRIKCEMVVNRHTLKLDTDAWILVQGKNSSVVSIDVQGEDSIILAVPRDSIIEGW